MFAWIAGKWAATALFRKKAGSAAARVPWYVWAALALAIALWFGVRWHARQVTAYGAERFQAGVEFRDQTVRELQRQLDAEHARVAVEMRRRSDAERRAIAARADAIRVRGPGKATCTSIGGLPASASGHQPAGAAVDDGLVPVHNQQWPPLVGLPFDDTVNWVEAYEQLRAEVISWRASHAYWTAKWAEYRAAAERTNSPARDAPR